MNFFTFSNKKNSKKLKDKLEITQKQDTLIIRGLLNNTNYAVKELWLFSREENGIHRMISKITPSNLFEFKVPLNELLPTDNEKKMDILDWYIKIEVPFNQLSKNKQKEKNVEIIDKNGEKYAEYFMRLGRFDRTNIHGLAFYYKEDHSIINYITTNGNLSLTRNLEPDSPTKIQIEKFKTKKSVLKLEGKLFTRNSLIQDGQFVLKGRDTDIELKSHNVTFNSLTHLVEKNYGLNRYKFSISVDLSVINNGSLLEEDVYDLYLLLNLHDKHEMKYVRLGRPTFRTKLFMKDIYGKDHNEAIVVNPYFTFKASNLSLEVYSFSLESFNYLQRMMRWSWLIQLFHKKEDIWIVGERSYKAQDTGLAFFKYVRTNYPNQKVYYVIDKSSPEKGNAEKYGNVLDFKSKEHIWNTIVAKKVISSHHPDYLFPIRTSSFKAKVKADKIFLQHGVMGTKNMVANYGKDAPGFDTDFFMVSSDSEKEMIINDFGYKKEEVFVTGLSRFDSLFEKDVKLKRQILIIPTWRDYIVMDDSFFESEYYNRYKNLIENSTLHELADKYNFKIIFCLHPNMQKFSKHFEHPNVRVISQGEVDVQHLIKSSAMMVTDYSSVGFDFSFLDKPVIYYQFDRAKFIGKRPSHLDLDNDLPGDITDNEVTIVDLIEAYAQQDFSMKPEFKKRASKFIKYRDQQSSKRIYDVVINHKAKRRLLESPKLKMLLKALFNKYRKSDLYFPSMRLFYKIGSKLIPVDKKLILFESGIGKQFGDSPKNIYDEIVARKLPYKKVWVYNKNLLVDDEHTKYVKRLSPQYYYYLLRAGYWVNNQNFPTYIKKRAQTTYLQTWHGTPLKKMLFDIEEVHGRSDDYVQRVGEAVKNWDYLISPSNYATRAFRSAFKYNGEILEVGYPRNDIFYRSHKETVYSKVKEKLSISSDKKIILYAPTFRDDQAKKKNKFSFDLNMDLVKMKERLGDDYVLLLRMHVVISSKIEIDETLEDFVYNVSSYPDIQDLLVVTDILITDYSSVMFDFANTKKPIIFYTYDLDHYRDDVRGFYMDLEKEAPGPLVYDTNQIIENILHIEQMNQQYKAKYNDFYETYCSLEDGNASKRVVDRLFQ
ncbi:CDP-glycerol glycerophosphotransferase family protein [Virgibacillus sp. MG-45]|uniref:CDP-glycerol glycerophosphotransferase family protein n=1 Tax=Virgibacillus sp. MG-45 TaxID=3102791 RepID=UPI002ED874E1